MYFAFCKFSNSTIFEHILLRQGNQSLPFAHQLNLAHLFGPPVFEHPTYLALRVCVLMLMFDQVSAGSLAVTICQTFHILGCINL